MPNSQDPSAVGDGRVGSEAVDDGGRRDRLYADKVTSSSWRPPVTLAQLLAAPDREALVKLLHEQARFHSPVADYDGRSRVAHLLSIIPTVVTDMQVRRQLAGSRELTSLLTGQVGDQRVDVVIDEHYDPAGAVIDATLMLRPLSALHTAVKRMGGALAAAEASQRAAGR